jgi:hypothetical protein
VKSSSQIGGIKKIKKQINKIGEIVSQIGEITFKNQKIKQTK